MSLEQTACDDLKAFERRLTEVIACLQPATQRWRILLGTVSICTGVAAWYWLTDPITPVVPLTQSFWNHPFFTFMSVFLDPITPVVSLSQSLWNHPFFIFTCSCLVVLFIMGAHRKVIAPNIITARTRLVLNDFNMSCDETGKLILKPRPPNS